jgi:hypothetical protein
MLRRLSLALLLVLWLTVLVAAGRLLLGSKATPGTTADTPRVLPEGCLFQPAPGRIVLLLFVHPHCPCTQASLDELAWLLARAGDQVDAWAVLVAPNGAPTDWERGRTGRAAESVASLRVWTDQGGSEARRFGATTSGQALIYGPDRKLAFKGGITDGRGHRGSNPGRDAALAALAGRPAEREWPVFGCPLFDQDSVCLEEASGCVR